MTRALPVLLAGLALASCSPPAPPPPPAASTPAAAATSPSPPAASSQRTAWNEPTTPFRIIGNVHYVGTAGLGAYLFTGPQGHVLLDGALPESVPEIEANIRELGFKLEDIKIILNSHAHFDHSGGLAQLKADTGAQLAAMEGDVSALESGSYLGSEDNHAMDAPPVKVDRVLKPGDKVELPGISLIANLTPGHTRGCTSWSTTASEKGENYEVLVFCSASVAANRITPPLQYAGVVEDYRRTFAWAKTAKVDIFLAPHGEFFGLAEKRAAFAADPTTNPFIKPGEFTAFAARQADAFEKTLAERTAAMASPSPAH